MTVKNKTSSYVVNQLVANHGVMFVKLHQYHWYVQGPDFFTLHDKFEELYNETSVHFDAFAERLLAKGEKPFSTLQEFLEHATISEAPYEKKIPAEKMVSNVIEDYRAMKELTNDGIKLASEDNDHVTEDMLVAYNEGLETTIWMLQAYLGKYAN